MNISKSARDPSVPPEMRTKAILLSIVLVGLALRLIAIGLPLLDTRQAQTAAIARHLYRNGYNVLYPQVDWLGSGPGYLVLEFPLFNLIVALLYLPFGVHEVLGQLVSVTFWVGTMWMLYRLAKKYYDTRVAVFALLFFALSPLSISLSRAFQPESTMLFLYLATVYYFSEWSDEGRNSQFVLAAFCGALAILVKMPAVFVGLPLLYLAYLKYGRHLFGKPKLWLFAILILLPATLWYYHGAQVNVAYPSAVSGAWSLSNWFSFATLISPQFYLQLFETEIGWVLTPLGFVLLLLGLALKVKDRRELLFHVWLASVGLYLLVFNYHAMTHNYYHLPMVPVAAIFIGKALAALLDVGVFKRTVLDRRLFQLVAGVVVLGIVLRYAYPVYITHRGLRHIPEAARAVQQVTKPDDLVIASTMDGNPGFMYYSDRKGWGFTLSPEVGIHAQFRPQETVFDPVAEMEALRAQGAVYYAESYIPAFISHQRFAEYMYQNYRVVADGGERYIIFDIRERLGQK